MTAKQQLEQNIWKPIAYASSFSAEFESQYYIIEVELLTGEWLVEHFKNHSKLLNLISLN